ncbi:hypothetical protein ADN00_01195 [Ornatilinea apprima]|uniref:Bifunctional NAD(P)H-hydrate repair enzyme n=1 Tax=Ornatilinea apprima TaxID=1134406 RepID=A0A0N8GPG5_9CHLR|nr:NAD(P)H-hydrate dehydratase [Ornatilinea apprima]KPL80834.1 hypothetical protein ADN00_01195 [Ornatilinea apprima]
MKLLTVDEIRALEADANAKGMRYETMIENAGSGLAEVILSRYGEIGDTAAVGLVGSGNNGGDALVALTRLAEAGWEARAYLASPREDGDRLVKGLLEAGGEVVIGAEDPRREQLNAWLHSATVLMDGVLGTGIRLPLRKEAAELLRDVKKSGMLPHVVAVDCPSGVDCASGEAAPETLQAELTVCMEAVKTGLMTFPAFELCGEIVTVAIGVPEDANQRQMVIDADLARGWLPERRLDAHKGTFGTAVIVAGSVNYPGAALLAARAAYRIGSGLVTCGTIAALQRSLAGQLPEATWLILPEEMGVISEDAAGVVLQNLNRATALLLGSGFGQEEATGQFLKTLLHPASHSRRVAIGFVGAQGVKEKEEMGGRLPPLVVDADGLKLLAKMEDWWKKLPANSILTPHPGEMSILSGLPVAEVQKERMEIAREMAERWGQVVVLKGALTVIAEPGGRLGVIPVASPALARAGTGDVLAGMITGLRAQGVGAFEAAAAGAWIHAQAGLLAAEKVGHSASVLAGDVVEAIADVLSEL